MTLSLFTERLLLLFLGLLLPPPRCTLDLLMIGAPDYAKNCALSLNCAS